MNDGPQVCAEAEEGVDGLEGRGGKHGIDICGEWCRGRLGVGVWGDSEGECGNHIVEAEGLVKLVLKLGRKPMWDLPFQGRVWSE